MVGVVAPFQQIYQQKSLRTIAGGGGQHRRLGAGPGGSGALRRCFVPTSLRNELAMLLVGKRSRRCYLIWCVCLQRLNFPGMLHIQFEDVEAALVLIMCVVDSIQARLCVFWVL